MRPFKHTNAEDLGKLFDLLEEYGTAARVNAGGTDLLSLFKDEFLFSYPEIVINIKPINELKYIKVENGLLKVGALTKLYEVVSDPFIDRNFPILKEAAKSIGTPQIRNMGTVGGNICQDIRCWYYRYPRSLGGPLKCARKGEGPCLAVTGDNRYHALLGRKCFAVCPSDLAIALSAVEGKVSIQSKEGERKVSIEEFYHPLGTVLKPGEIVKGLEIPIYKASDQSFTKFTLRKPIDFAIVSVAKRMIIEDGVIKTCALALGGCSYTPFRPKEAENFLQGKRIEKEIAQEAAELAIKDFKPLSKNAYKIQIIKTLVRRAIYDDSTNMEKQRNFV